MKQKILVPFLKDVYPDKAQYLHGDVVKIIVEIENPDIIEIKADVAMTVSFLEKALYRDERNIAIPGKTITKVEFSFAMKNTDVNNYGVDISLKVDNGKIATLSTAFDTVSSWKEAFRYGFLSDFYKEDEEDSEDIKQMVKYHLNVAHFYDWMYRHEDLLPSENYFTDPLGRKLSLKAVKNKIDACHKYGIKAFAYGAIYGASDEFYKSNKEWALYKNNEAPQGFDNWLYIMNTAPESPWSEHIVNEFKKAVELLDFDGIHMDAYGWPKTAYSKLNGMYKLERLQEHFPVLIESTRTELEKVKEDIGLVFNAVSNWPEEVLESRQTDAVYIEVWAPYERYIHLNQLVNHGRESGKKMVILAAYLKPFSKEILKDNLYLQKYTQKFDEKKAETSFLLSSAVIFASGGYHFLLGEYNGILTNNYYVDHGQISDVFVRTVRNYFDFIVRYGNLLFDQQLADLTMTYANGINDEYKFENGEFSSYGEPDKVWTIVKEMPGYKTISLINLSGIKSDLWNEEKNNRPKVIENIYVSALVDEEVSEVYTASPDINNGRPEKLELEYLEGTRGRYTRFKIPRLEVWSLVYIIVK